ncbi:MAG: SufD family Fe-S cluster assembly protein [Propionibacteriaceae bacterium]|jgi:Fe-S cluster assembly protein SufD|nr:SufD family Fe-S cluster assembly protein [Propionibacteriaceae bacterium]
MSGIEYLSITTVDTEPRTLMPFDHLSVYAKPNSAATLRLLYPGSGRFNGEVEIDLAEGARLTIISIQDWRPEAVAQLRYRINIGKDAELRHAVITLQGQWIQHETAVTYTGPGGRAELLGVYFAGAGQHLQHSVYIDHNQPNTTSLVDYRGALQGENARSSWVGEVSIRPEGIGTDTYESNKNLILSDGCRVDAVPNLEIETGEVRRAGHSATAGRFDDEQLFYLMSRGISPAEARRLVVQGFFASILARIGDSEDWMERINASVVLGV